MQVDFFHMLGLFWFLEISKSCFLNGKAILRLNYLNANGYVHRDIKPENIMYKVQPCTASKLNSSISHIRCTVVSWMQLLQLVFEHHLDYTLANDYV